MQKYSLNVVQSRVYVDSDMMVPLVSECFVPVAAADTFSKLVLKIRTWLKDMGLSAVEFNPEAGYLLVEKKGLMFECEFSSDEDRGGALTQKQAAELEKLLG